MPGAPFTPLRGLHDPCVDALFLTAQIERPPLEPGRLEPGRGRRLRTHEDLARPGQVRQPGGRVDRVAERGEIRDVALADGADEARARVDGGADRKPGLRSVVAGLLEQRARSRDRVLSVIVAGEAGDE